MVFPRLDFEKTSCKDADVEKGRLAEMFDRIEAEGWNLHSLFLARNGAKVFDAYAAGSGPGIPEEVYSCSKTFVAAALGLCQDQGLLKIDEPILPHFASALRKPPLPGYEKVTIRHLLAMAVGTETEGIDPVLAGKVPPEDSFFRLPLVHEPGTHFFYNNYATFLLSRLVWKLTGEKLNDYLDSRLYQKIGMAKPRWREALGNTVGPYGLQLAAPDLARFGILLQNEGFWRGEQVLSAAFVREMGKLQVPTPEAVALPDRNGYGLQVWINPAGGFRLAGMYKQYVIVDPKRSAVFVAQAYETREVFDLYQDHVLPALEEGWKGDTVTLRDSIRRFELGSVSRRNAETAYRDAHPDGIPEFPFGF